MKLDEKKDASGAETKSVREKQFMQEGGKARTLRLTAVKRVGLGIVN